MDAEKSITPLVYAPNLHLFAFHLWRGLTGKPDSIAPNSQLLWQQGDKILENLGFQERLHLYGYNYPDAASELPGLEVNLHPNKQVNLTGKLPNDDLDITGRIFAHRLYDSYSLTVNFRRDEEVNGEKTAGVEISFWQKLNQEGIFLPDFVESSLGQTLLLTAFLPQEYQKSSVLPQEYQESSEEELEEKNLKDFAQKCLRQLISEAKTPPPLHKMGELFGSPIFEFGGQILDADLHGEPVATTHVLIWLFREDLPSAKFVAAYRQFIDLFYYRNKILSAYRESRILYREIYNIYIKLEEKVKGLKDLLKFQQESPGKRVSDEVLNELRGILEDLAQLDLEYARLLRNYKHSRNTISINSKNYEEKLKAIVRQLQDKGYPAEDLDFFREFTSLTAPYFQTRIADELNYFVEGSSLADKAVATIRGIVEIEQTQRDRLIQDQEKHLENTIQALGLALGTGAIVASSAGLITQPPSPWENENGRSNYPHPFFTALLLSSAVAIVIYILAKIWQNWGKKS